MKSSPATGYCLCGCGGRTSIIVDSDSSRGYVRGQHFRFLRGHGGRVAGPAYIENSVTGCWVWQRHKDDSGYGTTQFRGRKWKAHRVHWVLANGEIPRGALVLHKCDNPACVNPGHLFLGTQADNMRDCRAKNRGPHGERHWSAKLTAARVREIRALDGCGKTRKEIGAMYGVSGATISQVINGKLWRSA